MLAHDQPFMFRNTAMNIEYCADALENAEWGNLQWHSPDEETASHTIYEWCKRYIAAYDYHHGNKPED